jgi:hypothetical protein
MLSVARVTDHLVRVLLLLVALSLLPARAGAEGSTLSAEKLGACALLTAADAQRVANVPMEFQARASAADSPGRTCAYRNAQASPASGPRTVEFRLLDAREWSRLKERAESGTRELEGLEGIGDEAYVVAKKRARRQGALTVFVRRRSSQFSVRLAGVGLALTEPMKQLARSLAGRF